MKVLKWVLGIIGILVILGYFGMGYLKTQTKKASPEETVTFKNAEHEMSVFYCRPYKKDREIFGGLVPFGEVWRTGANEATTFTTNQDINFAGKPLKAGTYTLWTIPGEIEWTVILNDKMYDWGVGFDSKAQRQEEYDVIKVDVPTITVMSEITEQFTISFDESGYLRLAWDNTLIIIQIDS